jgi:hypothetical protein
VPPKAVGAPFHQHDGGQLRPLDTGRREKRPGKAGMKNFTKTM